MLLRVAGGNAQHRYSKSYVWRWAAAFAAAFAIVVARVVPSAAPEAGTPTFAPVATVASGKKIASVGGGSHEHAAAAAETHGALVVGQEGQLTPGAVVGQGRYVLVEKLCDLQQETDLAGRKPLHPNMLPPPSERLLSLASGRLLPSNADGAADGQLVPYEGLCRAIEHDLPQLPRGLTPPARAFLPAVHDYSVSFVRSSPFFSEDTWGYRFGQRLGKGSFGEAWRAVALDGSMNEVVLKRLFAERGRKSGEREIYYGIALQNRPHISRFISSFERQDPNGAKKTSELWLVFHNEGFSLNQHIFQIQPDSPVVKLSNFWWHVKSRQPLGGQVIKNIMYQLLHAVAVAHEQNITHRDIKLSNVLMTDTWPPVVRLGDWGSALSIPPTSEVLRLYEPDGPTEDEETDDYRPPEAIFDQELLAHSGVSREGSWRTAAYDLFSLGVLLLELILGTRGVFRVDDRRWLRLEHDLRQLRVPVEKLEQGRQLQAMVDMCVGPPGSQKVSVSWYLAVDQPGQLPFPGQWANIPGEYANIPKGQYALSEACSDEEFAAVLKRRDPSGVGFPNEQGRDLLRQLLRWLPQRRISARAALAHPWFDDGALLPQPRFSQNQAHQAGPGTRGRVGHEQEDEDEQEGEEEAEEGAEGQNGQPADHAAEKGGYEDPAPRALPPTGKLRLAMASGTAFSASFASSTLPQASKTNGVGANAGVESEGNDVGAHDGSDCDSASSVFNLGLGEEQAEDAVQFAAAVQGSRSLVSECPGLHLHVAARGDIGRRREMEDRHVFGHLGGSSSSSGGSRGSRGSSSSGACMSKDGAEHVTRGGGNFGISAFVGVYDGHSGDAVAQRLRQALHRYVVSDPSFPRNISSALVGAFASLDQEMLQERLRRRSGQSEFRSVADHDDGRDIDPGSTALLGVVSGCQLHLANLGDCRAVAARRWQVEDDASEDKEQTAWPAGARVEVRQTRNGEPDGQRGTIVEVRSPAKQLYIVRLHRDESLRPFRRSALRLLSELRAVRLTEDHKPSSQRERLRIEALGGQVESGSFVAGDDRGASISSVGAADGKGTARIVGLATSRSFGSFARRPYVTADPDIFEYTLDRHRDVFVILASDGVWDVLDDQFAVDLVWDQLSSVHDIRRGPTSVLEGAAELIVKTAIKYGSTDNLTCAVILFQWSSCGAGGDCGTQVWTAT